MFGSLRFDLIINSALFFIVLCRAAPAPLDQPEDLGLAGPLLERLALTPYAPVNAACPTTPLVRPATSLSSGEAKYVSKRNAKASKALYNWLGSQGHYGTYGGSHSAVIGYTSSGGGYRSLLCSAGVTQGFDARDSSTGVSGVYQGITYQGGLSGGSWFLSSLAANNWPTVTSLKTGLWEQAFQNSLLLPANLLSPQDDAVYAAVTADIAAKAAAGYNVTIVDPYGRLLSYQLLYGTDGGVGDSLSGLTALSNFTSFNVPYPIIVTTTDFPDKGQCYPTITGPIFEFHPYEYGSWDRGVNAFALTPYMGSDLTAGKPTTPGICTRNYDNIGYIFGTSADVFNGLESGGCFIPSVDTSTLPGILEGIIATVETPSTRDLFGVFPNPFYQYPPSPLVKGQTQLTLSDGGEAGQNNPIWPFIQPERNVDLLIVNDNSADTSDNFPNGTEIRQTYLNAQRFGLPKMPYIPPVATFVAQGLNKRATFFGCNGTNTMFIVYLPNVAYSFPSNQPTSKIEYTKAETDAMIANGVQIATQNGDSNWPFCLACAIEISGSGSLLPSGCDACLVKYCYQR